MSSRNVLEGPHARVIEGAVEVNHGTLSACIGAGSNELAIIKSHMQIVPQALWRVLHNSCLAGQVRWIQ